MATTTNYGWETPDDTDLVKDGASAIRTLGSSIDSTFAELKGGTSGQVLTKASNTDNEVEIIFSGAAGTSSAARLTALGALSRLPKALTEGVLSKQLDGEQILTILTDLLVNNWAEVPAALTWSTYPATTTWANAENTGLGDIDTGIYVRLS